MPTMREFLEAVLPRQGLYCLVALDPERNFRRQEFHDDLGKLEQRLRYWDAHFEGTRGAVYHACASFGANNRTQSAVASIRSLWLDIDCGKPDAYPTVGDGLAALEAFVERCGLPRPLLVSSGSGLHVYWPLSEELTRGEWQPYADGLKRNAAVYGLRADPTRTADAASILRPVGTHNRKREPAKVVCGPLVERYALARFSFLLGVNDGARAAAGFNYSLTPRTLNGKPQSALLKRLLNVTVPEYVSFDTLAENCAQLGRFKATRGNISEPEWYAGLGVLAWCHEGDGAAHAWSNGHPQYDPGETDERLRRVRLLTGPTTCAQFKTLNKLCEGCPFYDAATTPLDSTRMVSATTVHVVGPTEEINSGGPVLEGHPEYKYDDAGCLIFYEHKQGLPVVTSKLAAFPVKLSSIHTGEVTAGQHYYLVNHWHPHDGWKDVELKASDLHSSSMIAKLSDSGVVIHDAMRFSKYVRDSADVIRKREKTGMAYEQFGWKDNATSFLYGDRLYAPEACPTPALSEELRGRSRWLRPTPGGSVDGWKQAVDNLMGKGSESMSFTVLASFASTLIRFLDNTEGGAVIQLVTRHSGAGKSTSLSGALTVWSGDKRGLELTTIDTKVSKGRELGLLCNLPAIYDEFQNKDPAMVAEFMIMYTSGRDKKRANNSGQVIVNPIEWRNFLLTAGNQSMTESIMAAGTATAPAARILELPVESSGVLKQSELIRLAEVLSSNAGHAGDAYLRYLMLPGVLPWVQENLLKAIDYVMDQCSFEKEHRFWARTLATTLVAATLVDKAGLITFSPDRIMDWAMHHFSQKVISKEERARNRSMLPIMAQYLDERLDETLTMPQAPEGRRQFAIIGERPKRKVAVRIEADSETAYVAIYPLRLWLEKNSGGGFTDMLTEMNHAGMLKSDYTQRTLTAGTDIFGGQVPCIAIDLGHPMMTGQVRAVREEVRKAHVVEMRK